MSKAATFHNPDLRFDYYIIVPHPCRPAVLMLSGERGWSLPHFVSEEHHFGVIGHISKTVSSRLGLAATVLRCVYDAYDQEANTVNAVYLVENHSERWEPPAGAAWVSRDELGGLCLQAQEHRAALEDWFDEVEAGEFPASRAPWARPGWFDRASGWIQTQLHDRGLQPTGPIKQMKNWGISCILKAPTTRGDVYFKAATDFLTNEPALVKVLAEDLPLYFPEVLSVDAAWRWMLTLDMGGKTLSNIPELELWEDAMRRYARIQIAWIERTQELLALSCPRRDLELLQTQTDSLLADTRALRTGSNYGLSDMQIEELRSYAPTLKAMCEEMANIGIPYTLEHGDFWGGNIIVTDKRFIFFDWSFSCVAHPFFSLGALAPDPDYMPRIPGAALRLRDAYLKEWAGYGARWELQKAFELAQPLGFLHSALTHYKYVLPGLEPKARWEMENMVGFYLSLVLEHKSHQTP
jgi:Phosphotransferase enzyme family